MISKRIHSQRQKILLSAIDMTESIVKRIPLMLSIGGFFGVIALIQAAVNHHVEVNCPESISVVVHHPTAMGPAYQCVSRVQLRGPAPAFKP